MSDEKQLVVDDKGKKIKKGVIIGLGAGAILGIGYLLGRWHCAHDLDPYIDEDKWNAVDDDETE